MSIAIAVKHMMAAGMSPDAVAAAVAEMEASFVKPRSSAAVRQERYRRNKASRVTVSDVCDGSSPLVPPLDVSPIPPSLTPPIIPPSDQIYSEGVTNAAQPKAKKEPSRFDEFWSIYPKRDGSNPKEPARQKFDLACKRGADPQAIISAAQRYAEQQKRLGNIGSPYVKQAVSWLNAQSWKDDYGSASTSASDDYAKQREFLARLPASQLIGYVQQFYQKRFVWKVDLMGPPPSSPDTLVPPEMINEAKEGIQHEQIGSQSVARGGMPVNRIYNVA